MPRLSNEERNRLIGHLQAGIRIVDAAKIFNVSKLAVIALKRKFERTGSVKDKVGKGRSFKTTNAIDEEICRLHELDPFRTTTMTASQYNLSRQTIGRRLVASGIKCYRPAIRCELSEKKPDMRDFDGHVIMCAGVRNNGAG